MQVRVEKRKVVPYQNSGEIECVLMWKPFDEEF
jgi:hypothetical protein